MSIPATQSAEAVYLPSRAVLDRYGRKHSNWLWRIMKADPDFPKPVPIGNQNYWRLTELEAYEAAKRKAAAQQPAAS